MIKYNITQGGQSRSTLLRTSQSSYHNDKVLSSSKMFQNSFFLQKMYEAKGSTIEQPNREQESSSQSLWLPMPTLAQYNRMRDCVPPSPRPPPTPPPLAPTAQGAYGGAKIFNVDNVHVNVICPNRLIGLTI